MAHELYLQHALLPNCSSPPDCVSLGLGASKGKDHTTPQTWHMEDIHRQFLTHEDEAAYNENS